MATESLAFWLHPDWFGDSRDNPRDPKYEPFWMRTPHRETTCTYEMCSRKDEWEFLDHFHMDRGNREVKRIAIFKPERCCHLA